MFKISSGVLHRPENTSLMLTCIPEDPSIFQMNAYKSSILAIYVFALPYKDILIYVQIIQRGLGCIATKYLENLVFA